NTPSQNDFCIVCRWHSESIHIPMADLPPKTRLCLRRTPRHGTRRRAGVSQEADRSQSVRRPFLLQAVTAVARFVAGHYDEAVVWAAKAHREQPSFLGAIRNMAQRPVRSVGTSAKRTCSCSGTRS